MSGRESDGQPRPTVHDLAGRRAEAVKVYQRIVDDHERQSAAWPAKVGLVTPYLRR